MQTIFEQALGITSPWMISNVEFNIEKKRLDITVDYKKGTTFFYEDSENDISGDCKVYDSVIKFHQKFGARIISEDNLDFFFEYNKEDYIKVRHKYSRYFSKSINFSTRSN